MMSSEMTPLNGLSSRSGMYNPHTYETYSAFSKEYSVADMSARFGSLAQDWSLSSAKETPRASATPGLSFLSNQQIYKRIVEWFEVWRPWQQRILLCGITNRCSTNQLESLATALEPVFHRDFAVTLQHRYPSASFKTPARKPLLPAPINRKSSRKPKPKPPGKKSNISLRNRSQVIIKRNSVSTFSEVSLEEARALIDQPPIATNSLPRIPDIPVEDGSVAPPREDSETVLPAVTKSLPQQTKSEGSNDDPPKTVEDLAECIVQNVMSESLQILRDQVDSLSALEPKASKSGPVHSRSKRGKIDEENAPKPLPLQGRDMLKYMLVNDNSWLASEPTQHHNAWASHTIPNDATPTQQNLVVKQNNRAHHHKSACLPVDDLHTKDFFNIDRFKVFASYRQDARFGHLRRPDMVADVNIPVQSFYKIAPWFPSIHTPGTFYVAPKSAHLKNHFKEQIEQIWEWMDGWQDFEKLHLLKRLVRLCNSDLLNYLVQCLYTRLHERCGLNWLPDKLLLLVFSYLNYDDIVSCSQVCRRWKYLTSVDELWMLKCHEHGVEHGVPDMTQQMALRSARVGEHIDWRLAFLELQQITAEVKASIPVPETLTFEGPTPVGMQRVNGKFVPADPEASEMSEFASVSDLPDNLSELTVCPRGIGARLAHESDKLKKSYRERLRYLAEKEAREAEERIREQHNRTVTDSVYTDDDTFETDTNAGSRVSQVRSRLRENMHTAMSEAEGLPVVPEERPPTPAPQNLLEWVERMAKNGEECDVSLDVRSPLVQATDVIPKKSSSRELLRKSETSLVGFETRRKVPRATEVSDPQSQLQSVRRARRFYGHMDSVLTMALDRRRLVTASLDRTVRIFDIRDGRTIHKLCGHKGAVTCMAFDNEVLFTGSWDMTVMVWDLIHFERTAVLHGHRGSVTCMAQDNTYVLSGSHDGTVRVWSKTQPYEEVKVLIPHTLHIHTLTYDGTFVYTGSSDRTVVVMNVRTEEKVLTFTGHPHPVLFVTLQGSLLITSNNKGQVWFWNKDTGRAEAAIQAHDSAVTAVRYISGRFFTASRDMTIKEWDLKTMMCLRTLVGHKGPINDILVGADRLISVDTTGQVRICDFTLPLLKLGGGGCGAIGTEQEITIDHNIIEEAELLRPKSPPTPPTNKRRRKKRAKRDGKKDEKAGATETSKLAEEEQLYHDLI